MKILVFFKGKFKSWDEEKLCKDTYYTVFKDHFGDIFWFLHQCRWELLSLMLIKLIIQAYYCQNMNQLSRRRLVDQPLACC